MAADVVKGSDRLVAAAQTEETFAEDIEGVVVDRIGNVVDMPDQCQLRANRCRRSASKKLASV
jgi:hypothetical protein